MQKTLLLKIFLLFSTLAAFGQDSKKLGKSFVMTQNYNAQKCDAVGNNPQATNDILERTFVITVEAITTTGYVISVPEFNNREDLNEKFVKSTLTSETKNAQGIVSTSNKIEEIYFIIPIAKFEEVTTKTISNFSFTVGIPTIPAKLRFGNGGKGKDPRYFRFEGNVSLGLSAGVKYSFGEENKNGINLLAGFTVASVQVDSLSTKGKVNSNTSAASFSPHIGFVFEVEKFQFGLYTGVDYLYGEPNNYWVYRNKPWLGIGIGYSIFTVGGQPDKQTAKD